MKKSSLLLLPAALIITGCSSFSLDRKVDYKSAQPGPSLELPPDIKSSVFENRYAVPPTTLTTPAGSNVVTQTGTAAPLIPQGNLATLVKSGQQRWVVVQLPPEQVWKIAREFWVQTGFVVKEERPEAGVMETDWAENRAKIPQDIIRNTIGKVLDMLYSTAERDKFRTRLERGSQPGTTEVYFSHKGMVEVADSATDARVYKWQPRPADTELEAEMLQRFIVRINQPNLATNANKDVDTSSVPTQERKERAHVIKANDGIALNVDDNFESTWQRTGLALERLGFTLEDRNRQQGLFVLRYSSDSDPEKKSWADRLSFWKSDEKTKTATYRLRLINSKDANFTRLIVESAENQPADARVAEPILNLLQAQLR